MRILIVEDEKNLNRIMNKHFLAEGFVVDSCYDGEEAMYYIETMEYDIILLDLMLPLKNGYEVLQEARAQGCDTPVIILTAKSEISDIVKGLDYGADDYIRKPFHFDELMARIRVVTRRNKGGTDNIYRCADLCLDNKTHKVTRKGKELNLTPKEYALLELLIRNKNIVLSREQIINNLWNVDFDSESNVIDVYIRYLRRKVDEGFEEKLIHTVRGVGYTIRC